MPTPAVYVIGATVVIVGAVTAYVVKQHIWDPHISPKVHEWMQEIKIRATARSARRSSEMLLVDSAYDGRLPPEEFTSPASVELRDLKQTISRSGVETSQSTLRHRAARNEMDEPVLSLSFEPLSPQPLSPSYSLQPQFVTHDEDLMVPPTREVLQTDDLDLHLAMSPSSLAESLSSLPSFLSDDVSFSEVERSPFVHNLSNLSSARTNTLETPLIYPQETLNSPSDNAARPSSSGGLSSSSDWISVHSGT